MHGPKTKRHVRVPPTKYYDRCQGFFLLRDASWRSTTTLSGSDILHSTAFSKPVHHQLALLISLHISIWCSHCAALPFSGPPSLLPKFTRVSSATRPSPRVRLSALVHRSTSGHIACARVFIALHNYLALNFFFFISLRVGHTD